MIPAPSDNPFILDMLGYLAGFVALILAVIVPYFILMHFKLEGALDISQTAALLGGVVLGTALHLAEVTLHEFGHAFMVRRTGGRTHMICVRRWAYIPSSGQWGQIKVPENAEFAGFVQYSPQWGNFGARPAIGVSLGGVLATGSVALICALCACLGVGGAIWQAPLWALAAFFGMDVIVNLIPLRWASGGRSDGLHILEALRTGQGWSAESWAKTRLEAAEYGAGGIEDAEWAELRLLAGTAKLSGQALTTLIQREAQRRDDADTLRKLGQRNPWAG